MAVVTALVLALVAAISFGVSDFVGGLASRRSQVLRVVCISYPVGLVGMAAVAPLAGGSLDTAAVLWSLLAGIAGGLALLWFFRAMACGPMSVVSPLTALLVAALPLAVGMLIGDRPTAMALAGAAIAVVAVLLVSREQRGSVDEPAPVRFTPKVALLTVGSGTAFALYFVLLDQAGEQAQLWPLVISRAVATAVAVVVAAVAGQLRAPRGVPLRLALAGGALDVVANVAFVFALHAGMLSMVSVVTALYPAATVVLARVVLAEATGRLQRVGLLLAAVSVVLIAGSP